jgi:hypothetical protein
VRCTSSIHQARCPNFWFSQASPESRSRVFPPASIAASRAVSGASLSVVFSRSMSARPTEYTSSYQIHGHLNSAVFEAALRRLVSEIDAFHLRFFDDSERVRQHVDKSSGWLLQVDDFSRDNDPRVTAEDWMRTDMCHPFDLQNGPIFSEAILRVGPGIFFWYQIAHHIPWDASTAALIAARVVRACRLLLAGQPVADDPLEPVSSPFKSHCSYQASAQFERNREFWLDVVAGFQRAASVSEGQVQPASQMARRHLESVAPGDTADMTAAAWRFEISSGVFMVVAGAIYLHRVTGAEDIVLGFPVIWRIGERQRDTPGMAINILRIRMTVHGTTSIASLAQQATAAIVSSSRHQRYHHVEISRGSRLVNDALFGMVVIIIPFDYRLSFGNCAARAHNLANGAVDDLTVAVYDRTGGMEVSYDVNPVLYGAQAEKDIARRRRNVMNWLTVASPGDLAVRAQIMDAAERAQVLREWNDTAEPVPAAALPALFQARVTGVA